MKSIPLRSLQKTTTTTTKTTTTNKQTNKNKQKTQPSGLEREVLSLIATRIIPILS